MHDRDLAYNRNDASVDQIKIDMSPDEQVLIGICLPDSFQVSSIGLLDERLSLNGSISEKITSTDDAVFVRGPQGMSITSSGVKSTSGPPKDTLDGCLPLDTSANLQENTSNEESRYHEVASMVHKDNIDAQIKPVNVLQGSVSCADVTRLQTLHVNNLLMPSETINNVTNSRLMSTLTISKQQRISSCAFSLQEQDFFCQ